MVRDHLPTVPTPRSLSLLPSKQQESLQSRTLGGAAPLALSCKECAGSGWTAWLAYAVRWARGKNSSVPALALPFSPNSRFPSPNGPTWGGGGEGRETSGVGDKHYCEPRLCYCPQISSLKREAHEMAGLCSSRPFPTRRGAGGGGWNRSGHHRSWRPRDRGGRKRHALSETLFAYCPPPARCLKGFLPAPRARFPLSPFASPPPPPGSLK